MRSGSPSPTPARSRTAACSASSWSERTTRPPAASASSTRKWSTSPASATCSHLAPPAGASRTSPATRCRSHPRRGIRAGCRSGPATGWADPMSWGRRWGRFVEKQKAPWTRAWTGAPAATCCNTSRSRRRPPASCRTRRRWCSSGSPTSWGTGAWCCTPRSARASTRRGRWPPAGGWRRRPAWTPRRSRATTASCCDSHKARRSRTGRSSNSTPTKSPTSSPNRWATPPCSPPGSASAPPAPCCCRAATPASARRCGSSGSAPSSCWMWPATTRRFRSSWRRCANASRMSTTCPRCRRSCATSIRAGCASPR